MSARKPRSGAPRIGGPRIGAYAPRPPGSLKAAITELVTGAGGIDAAAELIGRGASVVHAYTDAGQPDTSMPVHLVRLLTRATGCDAVIAFLAAEAGYRLVRVEADAATALPAQMAAVGEEVGELFGTLGRAMADGRIEPHEGGQIVERIDDAAERLTQMRATAAAVRDGGGD